MVGPNTKIRWLTTTISDIQHTGTVQSLFESYITNSIPISNTSSMIDFTNLGVYIQDMTGYTKLYTLISSMMSNNSFIFTNADNLEVSECQLVPVYNVSMPARRGFHGEVKRDYVLKQCSKITQINSIRIYDEENKIDDYVEPIIESSYNTNHEYGYYINTESKFCTVNGVYMFTSDSITVEDAMKMYEQPPILK